MNLTEAIEYLKMYFTFYTELRTIVNDDTNVVTSNEAFNYSEQDIITMAEEARADVRAQIGYLL